MWTQANRLRSNNKEVTKTSHLYSRGKDFEFFDLHNCAPGERGDGSTGGHNTHLAKVFNFITNNIYKGD